MEGEGDGGGPGHGAMWGDGGVGVLSAVLAAKVLGASGLGGSI